MAFRDDYEAMRRRADTAERELERATARQESDEALIEQLRAELSDAKAVLEKAHARLADASPGTATTTPERRSAPALAAGIVAIAVVAGGVFLAAREEPPKAPAGQTTAPAPAAPAPAPDEPPVEPRDPSSPWSSLVPRVICRDVMQCYVDRGVTGAASGRLVVTLAEHGTVESAEVLESDAPDEVKECMVAMVRPRQVPRFHVPRSRVTCSWTGTLMAGGAMMMSFDHDYERLEPIEPPPPPGTPPGADEAP